MKCKGIIFIIVLFVSVQWAFSQENGSDPGIPLLTLDLDHLKYPVDSSRLNMISAGQISKSLEELPLQIYVVSGEEILNNQYTTLSDVLNGLPGIQVSRPGSGELGESFQIWNLTGNLYSKILINGVPIKPSVVSGMPIGSQLPIRQAEKIEIIYGNSSAIYGADAVSGVINIVTKEAYRGTFVSGDINLGANGHNYINFNVGGRAGKNNNILRYSFYGSKYELSDMNLDYTEEGLYNPMRYYETLGDSLQIGSISFDPKDVSESALSEDAVSEEEFMDKFYGEQYEGSLTLPDMQALSSASHMLGMQLAYKGFNISYNYMYRRAHSSLGLSPVFYKFNNPQNFWGESIQQFSISYVKDFGKLTSTTELNNLAYEMDNNSSQGLTFFEETDKLYRYSASNDLELNQMFSFSPFKNAEVVAGLSYLQSGNLPTTSYRLTPFDKSWYTPYSTKVNPDAYDGEILRFGNNPKRFYTASAHLQFYYKWQKFRFLGGLRYDYNDLYNDDRISPQLAILHKTSRRTSIRLSVGSAYKTPPTSLIYQSLAYYYGGKVDVVAYPYLETRLTQEKFTTIELGFTTNFNERFSLEQTFFSYRIKNHIVPYELPPQYFRDLQDYISDGLIYEKPVRFWANLTGSVSTVGGSQTTLRFKNIVKSIGLNAEASFYFQARQDNLLNINQFVEEYLTLSPAHSGKLKVSMHPTENMYVYVESHWMSKWYRILIPFEELYEGIFGDSDGFYAINAVWSYSLSNQLRFYVKATNIFNEKYGAVNATLLEKSLIYNPQLRRTIRIGLSYALN